MRRDGGENKNTIRMYHTAPFYWDFFFFFYFSTMRSRYSWIVRYDAVPSISPRPRFPSKDGKFRIEESRFLEGKRFSHLVCIERCKGALQNFRREGEFSSKATTHIARAHRRSTH